MDKYRAIPEGYMTVGEAAKKMGVTVRTLQYYDKEGLLSPSAESDGGRRLYTAKDLVSLHQILSMKHLGFSLDDIKNRLIPLDSPADMARVLSEQEEGIRKKINELTEALKEIEALKAEVLQMREVDFKKYADIIVNLQMKNEYYWMIKHFDDKTLDYVRERFDQDSGRKMMDTVNRLQAEALQLQKSGVAPASERGQRFAKEFWEMITEFTQGDMSLLPNLMKLGNDLPDSEWKEKQGSANAYIEAALDILFTKSGYDPFKGGTP